MLIDRGLYYIICTTLLFFVSYSCGRIFAAARGKWNDKREAATVLLIALGILVRVVVIILIITYREYAVATEDVAFFKGTIFPLALAICAGYFFSKKEK